MENRLEQMWDAHKDQVYSVLLALARDVDLADDCLQDTYLHARSAISTFRDGNPRAWLTAIAKNVFYSHIRRKSLHLETSLDTADGQADDSAGVGSDEYLDLLAVRDAISVLEPDLRKALIMKHYGNFDYAEIASHLSCTPAAAKHRVWRAVQKLRSLINTDQEDNVCCSELRESRIMDMLYGALAPREVANIEKHIVVCAQCRQNLAEMRKVAAILDKVDGDYRILTLIDIDERGHTTRYVWVKQINQREDIMRTWRWNAPEGWSIDYLALQGEPVEVRWPDMPSDPGYKKFEGDLPESVPYGQITDAMFIARPHAQSDSEPKSLGHGMWHYHHKHTPFPNNQAIFIVTIRMPKGARLLEVDPAAHKSSTRTGRTSLTWRVITEIVGSEESKWQFEANLEYVLSSVNC